MKKRFSTFAGVALILSGILSMAPAAALATVGLDGWRWGPWRLWPVAIVGLGLCFLLPPVLARGRSGFGWLFIPGVPILTTGAVLLVASVLNWWGVWGWLWPQVVLGLALGFLYAAIYTRVIWLVIPAVVAGLNGMVFQFCALTGLWEAWTVLWTVEPLSVGLALLSVGAQTRVHGLAMAGLILCGFAAAGLVAMGAILSVAAILPALWLTDLLGPVILVAAGLILSRLEHSARADFIQFGRKRRGRNLASLKAVATRAFGVRRA